MWKVIIALKQHTRSDNVGLGMPSSPCTTHTPGRCRAWYAIISLRQHSRPDDVRRILISWILEIIQCRTSGVACDTSPWTSHTIRRRRVCNTIMDFDSKNGRMMSDVVCPCRHWITHTLGRRRVCHAIIALEQHK